MEGKTNLRQKIIWEGGARGKKQIKVNKIWVIYSYINVVNWQDKDIKLAS